MSQLINLRKIAITLSMFALVGLGSVSVARADPFSFTSGTPGTSNYQNVSGTITAGPATVTITINNLLTNAQVFDVLQNVSGIYFNVSGGGAVNTIGGPFSSSANIVNTVGTVTALGFHPADWGAGVSSGEYVVCAICSAGMAFDPSTRRDDKVTPISCLKSRPQSLNVRQPPNSMNAVKAQKIKVFAARPILAV